MFRRFELTIGVYLPEEAPLPDNFNDWLEVAGLYTHGATPTTCERIVETRYPPSRDVSDRRGEEFARAQRSGARRIMG